LKIKAETRQSDSNPVSDSNTKDSDNQPNAPLYVTHKGRVIMDATACPQDIAYPTDLNLLNDAREKLEELIDKLYDPVLHHKKPRTYR